MTALDGLMTELLVWRHPKPRDVAGRCIGHTNVSVDPRKIKRSAHRIRRTARQQDLPRVVWTSPLQRCFLVGRCLARWGWQHHVDARLGEMDFGAWDGLRWSEIGVDAVDAWCADFAVHAPGGGESVSQVLARCHSIWAEFSAAQKPLCVVGHAGWISALIWLLTHGAAMPSAAEWPASVAYGSALRYELKTLRLLALNLKKR